MNTNIIKKLAAMNTELIIRQISDVNTLKEIIAISVENQQKIIVSSRCFSDSDAEEIATIGSGYLTVVVE